MEAKWRGSTRIIHPHMKGALALEYTDSWSAFDRGAAKQEIPGIGAARCACAIASFKLAWGAGIKTHYIGQIDSNTIAVDEFEVPLHRPLSGRTQGRVLPLEWIWRDRVKGSLLERLLSGAIMPEELGFPSGVVIKDGMKLPHLLLECTTKFEKVDRHLSDAEAMELAEITPVQFEMARKLVAAAVRVSNAQYERCGFTVPDGKLELGLRHDDALCVVDVFGTQDENRILDAAGEIYSKDLIRNYLKSTPWYKELQAAKKAYPDDKNRWPPYPLLPPDLVESVSQRYAAVAAKYARSTI